MCLNVISSHPTTKSKNCILTVTFHNLTVAKVAKLRLMAKWWKLVQVYALVFQMYLKMKISTRKTDFFVY